MVRAGMVSRRAPVTSSANATFSAAVRSSSRRKSWNTTPSRRRSFGTSCRRSSLTEKPETLTSPCEGRCSPKSSLRMVDLPAPLWPVRKTNSPFETWKETSFSARAPFGNDLNTLWKRITAQI